MKDFLTVEQVAARLQVSTSTIYTKIRNGEIPTHPWIEKPRIPLDALENWDVSTKDTFKERKLRQVITEKDQEILSLKNIIRKIIQTGLDSEM